MRIHKNNNSVTLWLSARDTYEWAHRPRAAWPCSTLSGRRLVATFDSNGLCDLSINGGRDDQDCDANEFNAICADYLRGKLEETHPAHFVAVGQFQQ